MTENTANDLADRMQDLAVGEPTTFPFMLLPMEIRLQVWKEYCDDFKERPRVLSFIIAPGDKANYCLPNEFLTLQTRSVRTIMAVHQETRKLVGDIFPDTLSFGHLLPCGSLRFHKTRDLVLFSSLPMRRNMEFYQADREASRSEGLLCPSADQGFFDQLIHMGIENAYTELSTVLEPVQCFIKHRVQLPALKTAYLAQPFWSRTPKKSARFQRRLQGDVNVGGPLNVRAFRATVFGETQHFRATRELIVCWGDVETATSGNGSSQLMLISDSDAHATALVYAGPRSTVHTDLDKRMARGFADDCNCWQE